MPLADSPHRLEVLLRVELETIVDSAVEVDGELWHPGDRAANVDQHERPVDHRQPAGDPEVAIEPRVVQDSSVDLDVELLPSDEVAVGARLDAQARRVGVRSGQPERRVGARSLGDSPSDQPAVADDVTVDGWLGPVAVVGDLHESGRRQTIGRGADRVER